MANTDFLNSPAGLALLKGGLDFGGGLLSGVGQAQMGEAGRNLSKEQLLQQLIQQQYQFDQSQGQQRASQGLASTQMNPAAQAEGLSRALTRGEAVANARPSQVSPPGSLAGFMPQMSGGAMGMIPQGGFSDVTKNALSPTGVLASAKNFGQHQASVDPATPGLDLGATFGQAGQQATGQVDQFRQNTLGDLNSKQQARMQALQQSLQQAQQQGNHSLVKKIMGAIAAIAPVALAPFTAGTSLAFLPAAVGAGAGAAAGALGGGGVTGGLMGGAMGGFGGYQAGQHPIFAGGASTPSMPMPGGPTPTPFSGLPEGMNYPQGPFRGLGPTGNDTPGYGLPGLPKPGSKPTNYLAGN